MYDKEFDRPLDLSNWENGKQFLGNLNYYRNLNHQLEKEVGDFLRANTVNPKLYSNDLRHQYTSALYARNLGDNWAKRLGDWNEVFNASGSGREDTLVDKYNNEVGRNYAKMYPDMPRQELLFKLLSDWDKNVENYENQNNNQ